MAFSLRALVSEHREDYRFTGFFGVDRDGFVYGDLPDEGPRCWDLDDPLASAATGVPVYSRGYWGFSAGHGSIESLEVSDGSFGTTVYTLSRFRCAVGEVEHVAGPFTLEGPRPAWMTASPAPTWSPDGAACWVEPGGLSCATLTESGISFARRFELSDIVKDLPIDPTWLGGRDVSLGPVEASWRLRLPTWLESASGWRFIVIAEVSFTSGSRSWGPFPFLVTRDETAAASWVPLVRPARPPLDNEDLQVSSLASVRLFSRIGGLDAIVGWMGDKLWLLFDGGSAPRVVDLVPLLTRHFACPLAADAPRALGCPGGGGIGTSVAIADQAAERLLAQAQAPLRVP
ncbi:MAG TPA: hypothetical protein PK095_24040, partial [Myxococcota bacterium]|nr:hypothetical protein [Myxococcota bacterium]